MADARDHAFEAGAADARVEIARVGIAPLRVARQHAAHVGEPALLQQPRRLDQHPLPFPLGQPRRQQHHPLVRRDAPGFAQPRHPRALDRGGREAREVGSARNDA